MSTNWMPPGMDPAEKDQFAADYRDPHMAAAKAWESWAASLAAEPSVQSVSTGAQAITYRAGSSPFDVAMERANWHRARTKVASAQVGPKFAFGWVEDERMIATYESAPLPLIGAAQVQLPERLVGVSDADNHP